MVVKWEKIEMKQRNLVAIEAMEMPSYFDGDLGS